MNRVQRPSSAKKTNGKTSREPPSDGEGSNETANEARKLLATPKEESLQAELDPRVNAASYVRERWRQVAPRYRPPTTFFSAQDGRDPDRDIERRLTDLQNRAFESDVDHVIWAANDLARRRDTLTREDLAKWWTAHRGGKGREKNKLSELFLLYLIYDRARRARSSVRGAHGAKPHRRHRRPRH